MRLLSRGGFALVLLTLPLLGLDCESALQSETTPASISAPGDGLPFVLARRLTAADFGAGGGDDGSGASGSSSSSSSKSSASRGSGSSSKSSASRGSGSKSKSGSGKASKNAKKSKSDKSQSRSDSDSDSVVAGGEILAVTGPLAQGQPGDWLIENERVRFVIQDAPRRDLHSVGQYGGNVIDAEVVGRPDRDMFFEFQPALNIETVVNAEFVELVNDGSDGTPAILRSCGPDDLLDYVNASSQVGELGVEMPNTTDDTDLPVYACTTYSLVPGVDHLVVNTTVENLSGAPVGLFIGDYANGMGQLEQWTPPTQAVGEMLLGAIADAQIWFGFRAAEGVDYSLVPVPVPGITPPFDNSSSFTTSGVTFVMHSHLIAIVLANGANATPTFVVPANGSRSFERRFSVGDGSPSRGAEIAAEIAGLATGEMSGCVSVGGAPAPGARVVVGPVQRGVIQRLASLFVTGPDGCYAGRIPEGSYGASAARLDTPFEGGAASPPIHAVSIASGVPVVQDFALPATGRLRVQIRDASGAPVPGRATVVGVDPTPEPQRSEPVAPGIGVRTGLFRDVTKDSLPFGVLSMAYAGADGVAELDVEPGTWQLVVSRGTEYSSYSTSFDALAGVTTEVEARIAQVLDTPGFVSSDYHVHMLFSPDSRIGLEDRVLSYAGEGVDNLIATDHDAHTDVNPTIQELGLTPFLAGTVGEEVTSFDYGHYNAYPQGLDPTRPSGGSTDWAGAAPIGEDFPSLGNFVLTPAEIAAAVETSPLNVGLDTVVHVNHIDSHFDPLQIDTSAEPPQSFTADPSLFRLDPSVANFFHPFPGLELWNGATVGAQGQFLNERMGIWMNLLNQAIPTTAIADSDTHTFFDLESAGARSWSASTTDRPDQLDPNEVGRAVKQGRLVGGQGPYVQASLRAASTGESASLALGAPTLASTSDGAASLRIHVQSPLWAPYDTIEIYANATTTVARTRGGIPTLFGAIPTQTLRASAGDFDVDVVDVAEAQVPGASRLDTRFDVPLTGLTEDTWLVVIVKGSVGESPPMFPVFARSLSSGANPTQADLEANTVSEPGVRALGYTNALYLDVDGNGRFDAPGVRVAP